MDSFIASAFKFLFLYIKEKYSFNLFTGSLGDQHVICIVLYNYLTGVTGNRRRVGRSWWWWSVARLVMLLFLLFQCLQRLADSYQFLAFLLIVLGFLEHHLALGGQNGALHVTKMTDDLALEVFQFGFQVGLIEFNKRDLNDNNY